MTDIKKYNIIISDTAKRSILSNYRYISDVLENEPAGFEHTANIYREIKKLEYMPRCHKIYSGENLNFECHVARIRQYLIFYKINEAKQTVFIVDVMHSHQGKFQLSDTE